MKSAYRRIPIILGTAAALLLTPTSEAFAQDVTVDVNDQKQFIQGFGGINHPIWVGDLTPDQRETAFGNDAGQLGFSVLRIFISENSNGWSREVSTAQRAQELGCLIFASPWNPPASMTISVNGQQHVNPQMYAEYAAHLTDFYNFMQDNGVDLYSVSIQNEPDYANEWTWWTADELLDFMRDYAGSLPFRVMAPESFQYRKQMSDPILNDPVALENLDILGAHLYGTQVRDFPYPLFKEKGAGKELWMTEVYYPNSDDNSADRWNEALDLGWHIHSAMVEAEFQAYVWWYIRRQYGPMKEDGTISKRGYSMAHFSKFVRPGFVRVEATKNPTNEVFVSAYTSDSELVAVVVNRNGSSQTLGFSVPGTSLSSFEQYTTSASKNLSDDGTVSASNGSFTVTVDGESVTTLRGAGDLPGTGGSTGRGGASGSGGASATGGGGGAAATGGTGGAGGSGGAPAGGNTGEGTGGTGIGTGGTVVTGMGGMVVTGTGGTVVTGTGGTVVTGTGGTVVIGTGGTVVTGTGGMVVTGTGGTVVTGTGGAVGTGTGGAVVSGGGEMGAPDGSGETLGGGGIDPSVSTPMLEGDETSAEEPGCGCRTAGKRGGSTPSGTAAALALLALCARRRRRIRSASGCRRYHVESV
jgi:glucuronoarabinoxylan endo-1,4-beta-xylanase